LTPATFFIPQIKHMRELGCLRTGYLSFVANTLTFPSAMPILSTRRGKALTPAILAMSVLDKYGFRTNNPIRAMEVAEEIVTLWYQLQK
jgi:hypothetical protein